MESLDLHRSPLVNLDVLLTWSTTRFAAVKVKHDARRHGASNYTVRKLVVHALNMATGFSTWPLRLASFAGFLFTLFGIGIFLLVVGRYMLHGTPVPHWRHQSCRGSMGAPQLAQRRCGPASASAARAACRPGCCGAPGVAGGSASDVDTARFYLRRAPCAHPVAPSRGKRRAPCALPRAASAGPAARPGRCRGRWETVARPAPAASSSA